MKASDGLRARAVALRRGGASLNEIVAELGVAKSTASVWVRDVPVDASAQRDRLAARSARAARMNEARWARHRSDRAARQAAVTDAAAVEVGDLTDREVGLLGAAIYWCEGAKAKPWRPLSALDFINSDPVLIAVFLRFLTLVGVARDEIRCRLSIHETADIDAATAWWRGRLGLWDVPFGRPVRKRHRPATIRRNVADDYHGCLIVRVGCRREIYWRIEGLMHGIAAAGNGGSHTGAD